MGACKSSRCPVREHVSKSQSLVPLACQPLCAASHSRSQVEHKNIANSPTLAPSLRHEACTPYALLPHRCGSRGEKMAPLVLLLVFNAGTLMGFVLHTFLEGAHRE